MLKGKTIILGITGGIAAYKAAELTSQLVKAGAQVWVAMTEAAQKFVTPLTFRTLSGNPVITGLFSQEALKEPVPHVSFSERADLIVIAPATANIIGKIAQGIADDALTTIFMTSKAPKLFAPAMNTNMWENKIVQENIQRLKKEGYHFIGPAVGRLACGDWGEGRMAEPEDIFQKIIDLIGQKQDFKGKKVLITAGGTREAIDPVRFIGNRSSGKMGYALAQAARDRGAQVTLISGPTDLKPPEGIRSINIRSAKEMKSAVTENLPQADVLLMAAAVADYTPAKVTRQKIKKDGKTLTLELEPTSDILEQIAESRTQKAESRKVIVGFSVETEDLVKRSREKLKEKKLDLIVANTPAAFEADECEVKLISRTKVQNLPKLPKKELAHRILDAIK